MKPGIKEPGNILIVDDNPHALGLLQSILSRQGFMVRFARSGKLALQTVSYKLPDLILLDIRMPEMDGYDVCRNLKDDPRTKDIPVIFISALEKEEDKVKAFEAGGVDYLTKPFHETEVLARINTHLDLYKMQQNLEALVRLRTRELQKAYEKIRRTKEEWERTFQAIGDIATVQDLDQRTIRVNRKACDMFSAEPEMLEGRFCFQLFRDSHLPCKGCPVTKCLLDSQVHSAEIVHENLNKAFVVTASPVLDENMRISGVLHFAKDVTTQKELERQLIHAQKMEAVGTLAGGIAHDFNNILMPIMGYSEMALDALPQDSPVLPGIHEVFKAANRAKELVQQILTFSRQTQKQVRPLKAQSIIKEALKFLRASIPASIEIKTNIDPECPPVLADPTQIHQIVMNLCTNAYHAMKGSGGILDVRLGPAARNPRVTRNSLAIKPGEYVRLWVSDTGHGMSRDVQEKIFDPYFTTKTKGEGTGLGLSVVHGIAKDLGGEITVFSEPGKGSTFRLYIPIARSAQMAEENALREDLPNGDEQILVIDDEAPIVELERLMLERLGFGVTVFTDSEAGLAAFSDDPDRFDLVMTDMTMPKINGIELAQKMLAIKETTPIILCTGFSDVITEEMVRDMGIRKLVMKPIVRQKLALAIREVLDAEGPDSPSG